MKAISKLFRSHTWPRSKSVERETPAGSGSSPTVSSSRHGGVHDTLKGLTNLARNLVPQRSSSLENPRPRTPAEGQGLRSRRVSQAPGTPVKAYPYDPDGVLAELDGKSLPERPLPRIQLSMPDDEMPKPEPQRAKDATLLRPGTHLRPFAGLIPVETEPPLEGRIPVATQPPPDGLMPVEASEDHSPARLPSAAAWAELREGAGLEVGADPSPRHAPFRQVKFPASFTSNGPVELPTDTPASLRDWTGLKQVQAFDRLPRHPSVLKAGHVKTPVPPVPFPPDLLPELREGSGLEPVPPIPQSLTVGVPASDARHAVSETPLQMPAIPGPPPVSMPDIPDMQPALPKWAVRAPRDKFDASALQQSVHDRLWSPPPPRVPDKIELPPTVPDKILMSQGTPSLDAPMDTGASAEKTPGSPTLPRRNTVVRSSSAPVLPASTGLQGAGHGRSHTLDAVPPAWRQTFQSILDRSDADAQVVSPVADTSSLFGPSRAGSIRQSPAEVPPLLPQAAPVELDGGGPVPLAEPKTPSRPVPVEAKPVQATTPTAAKVPPPPPKLTEEDQQAMKILNSQASLFVSQILGNKLFMELLGMQPPPAYDQVCPDGPPAGLGSLGGPGLVAPVA